jgi:hypothetical protein
MNPSNKLLSDITAFRTYAKYIPHLGRRESLEETINRTMAMDLDRFPKLSGEIVKAYSMVHDLKVMPSMRKLQFAGTAIQQNNARSYNCSFLAVDDVMAFSEILFLLLSGVGVGFSVQKHHISQLPKVQKPKEEGIFIVHDSIEGWAQALDLLMKAYFYRQIRPVFDFSRIRPKGSYLVTTGARAPGPEPLKIMLKQVEDVLLKAIDRKLKPIEVHDIICITSDAVLAGGIRRAALISLFDKDDTEMLNAKSGSWWEKYPWRARANNSAVLERSTTTKDEFMAIFEVTRKSGSGEPGFSWTNNRDWGFNPCKPLYSTILTDKGYITFEQALKMDSLMVMGIDGKFKKASKPFKTGEQRKIYKVTLSDGTSLYGTNNHLHMTSEGEWKRLDQLKVGDRLKIGTTPIYKDTEIENQTDYETGLNLGFDVNINQFDLTRLYGQSKEFKIGFIKSLFTIHGSVVENNVELYSVKKEALEVLSKLFQEFGVFSSITYHNNLKNDDIAYKLNVYAGQFKKIGFISIDKNKLLDSNTESPIYKTDDYVTVMKIDPEYDVQDVYDITVYDDTHAFIDSGVVTHNCHEISLRSNQFCNLSTLNASGCHNEKEFLRRVRAAAVLGTIQASYTDFPFLRPTWKYNSELEALLGVSMTGVADAGDFLTPELLQKGAKLVLETNELIAKKIGIRPAARATSIKPEGTSSCVLGSSSGIHDRHSQYYIRRIRMNKDDALYMYLKDTIPELCEDDVTSATGGIVSLPQESPKGSYLRENTSALDLLQRAVKFNQNWVAPGHRSGDNMHNVSVTISVRDDEWERLGEAMWKYRNSYTGISLLPFDGGTYKQAPFEACSKEKFEEMSKYVKSIDLRNVIEKEDKTERIEQLSCVGGVCEIS